ncbi:hypothetical protein HJFPF1_06135 [Paramyrothecium foliicola]|nr:hypothetical protein HJFPF1_06135 [Paramyrothecium foliicola]
MVSDRWIDEVVLVDQLPSNSWVEGLVIRPNGQGILSRLDQQELWTVDLSDPAAEPQLVHEFEEASGVINICPIPGADDEYAVISAAVDMQKVVFLDFILWRVKFHPDNSAPTVTKVTALPDVGMVIGVTPVTERIFLLADTGKHCVWWIDLKTCRTGILIEDDSMKAETDDDFFGLNRIRMCNGFMWYTNSSAGLLCRIPVEIDENNLDAPIRTSGEIGCVVDDISSCDGLVVSDKGEFCYAANYVNGTLWRIDVDSETGEGTTHPIMEHLVSPTSLELRVIDGKKKLYVVCCGELETGWVNDESRSWGDIAEINASVSISVTVTTEDAA